MSEAKGVDGPHAAVVRTRGWMALVSRPTMDVAAVAAASAASQAGSVAAGQPATSALWLLVFAVLAFSLIRVLEPAPEREHAQQIRGIVLLLAAPALAAVTVLSLRVALDGQQHAAAQTVRQWTFVVAYLIAARVGADWLRARLPDSAARAWEEAIERHDTADSASIGGTTVPAQVVRHDGALDFLIARELTRARRHQRPLTLCALELEKAPVDSMSSREELARLAALLSDQLRVTDLLGYAGERRLLALLPETALPEVDRFAGRVFRALAGDVADRVLIGFASFPDQEVTLVGLQDFAGSRLRPLPEVARSESRVGEICA